MDNRADAPPQHPSAVTNTVTERMSRWSERNTPAMHRVRTPQCHQPTRRTWLTRIWSGTAWCGSTRRATPTAGARTLRPAAARDADLAEVRVSWRVTHVADNARPSPPVQRLNNENPISIGEPQLDRAYCRSAHKIVNASFVRLPTLLAHPHRD